MTFVYIIFFWTFPDQASLGAMSENENEKPENDGLQNNNSWKMLNKRIWKMTDLGTSKVARNDMTFLNESNEYELCRGDIESSSVVDINAGMRRLSNCVLVGHIVTCCSIIFFCFSYFSALLDSTTMFTDPDSNIA